MDRSKWSMIKLTHVKEADGGLVCLQQNKEIPFNIERIFYIYDVPNQCMRADHASENTEFVLIALNGHVIVSLDDGKKEECFSLHEPNEGLFVPEKTWMKTYDFSDGAILLVVVSKTYEECKYFSSYQQFLTWKAGE